MTIQYTSQLADQLIALNKSPDAFAQAFSDWKAGGIRTEFSSPLFGKDGAYGRLPIPMSTASLKHVHLVPLADVEALKKWDKAHKRGSRKVSDRALVYAEDSRSNFLLIFILEEPTAHNIAEMKTTEHKTLMTLFATLAETWSLTGKVES